MVILIIGFQILRLYCALSTASHCLTGTPTLVSCCIYIVFSFLVLWNPDDNKCWSVGGAPVGSLWDVLVQFHVVHSNSDDE